MGQGQFDLLSAVIGFVAGVITVVAIIRLRQPTRELWSRIQARVQGARRWVSSGVEARYRQETAEFAQRSHLAKGLAHLDEIFVPTPFISPPPEPGAKPSEILPQPQLPFLWPELGAQLATAPPPMLPIGVALSSTSRLTILAPPGGGKSTLLAYLALRYSEDPELVPLYAHLAELTLEPERPGTSVPPVESPLIRAIQRRAGTLTADALPGLLQQALDDGRAVVLLDGWDELALSERSDYTRWIELLLARSPKSKYIVTAPSTGYGPFPEMGFVPLNLAPWQPEHVANLLERWAKALDTTIPTVPDGPELGAQKVPDLSFWKPGQTPLEATLGIMMILSGRIPSTRQARRFSAAVQLLLTQDDGDEPSLAREVGPRALAQLAAWMFESDTRVSPLTKLEEIIIQNLSHLEETPRRSVQDISDALLEKNGPLVMRGSDSLAFRSTALYAYFWAAHQALLENRTEALRHVHDPEWSHALSFLVEIADSGPLVERLLGAPPDTTRENLFRAADWLAKAQGTEQWHRIVMVRLAQLLLNPDTPAALRERATAALVATRDDGVGFLLRQAITSPNQALRAVAAAGLGALSARIPGLSGDESSLETLVKTLEDPSETVQTAVINALGFTRSKAATEALIRTLLESHATARRLAAEALGRMGTQGHEILREALTEDEVLVRRAALYGLAQIPDGWVNETLEEVIRKDSEWFIRSTAEEILNQRLAMPVPEQLEPTRAESLSWLINLAAERGQGVPTGSRAMTLLKETLEERQRPIVRAMAARSLGDIGEPDSSPLIAEALRDPDHHVREAAFFAFARLTRAWNQGAE